MVLTAMTGLSLGIGFNPQGFTADADAIARSLQDPLANISAIITDNTFNLDMGGDEERTGYDFQIQPVHSLQTDRGFSIVPRGVIPIGTEIIGLTPISPFRPRRWRGALLPYTAHVEIVNLDPEKRPLGASADSTEIKDVVSVSIRAWTQQSITVLFDHGHSLEERIIHEQFVE
jgi:hypothetical protein